MRDTGFVPFFRNKFPELFQDSDWFFKDSKIHINPFTTKISVLILLTVCHIFLYLSLTDFQNFPQPVAFFQDFLSPGKYQNKITGLSRFSRTRANPGHFSCNAELRHFLSTLFIWLRIKNEREYKGTVYCGNFSVSLISSLPDVNKNEESITVDCDQNRFSAFWINAKFFLLNAAVKASNGDDYYLI